jgi:hypothetical protein
MKGAAFGVLYNSFSPSVKCFADVERQLRDINKCTCVCGVAIGRQCVSKLDIPTVLIRILY